MGAMMRMGASGPEALAPDEEPEAEGFWDFLGARIEGKNGMKRMREQKDIIKGSGANEVTEVCE